MHRNAYTASDIFWVLQGHFSLSTEQFRKSRCYTFLHMCFPRASYTCLASHAITFWRVLSRLCQITMGRKSCIFLPPKITGVAKHNWLCSEEATFTAEIKLSAIGHPEVVVHSKMQLYDSRQNLWLMEKIRPCRQEGADGRKMLPPLGWFSLKKGWL